MRSFLSLSLAALAILAVSNAQPYNGFWKTCYYPVYLPETNPTDTLLDIICQFDTGQWTESRIYLSSCMTNDRGTLVVCWLRLSFKKISSRLNCAPVWRDVRVLQFKFQEMADSIISNFDSDYFDSCTNCTFEYQTQDPDFAGGNNFPANYTCECKNWDGNYQFTRVDLS